MCSILLAPSVAPPKRYAVKLVALGSASPDDLSLQPVAGHSNHSSSARGCALSFRPPLPLALLMLECAPHLIRLSVYYVRVPAREWLWITSLNAPLRCGTRSVLRGRTAITLSQCHLRSRRFIRPRYARVQQHSPRCYRCCGSGFLGSL